MSYYYVKSKLVHVMAYPKLNRLGEVKLIPLSAYSLPHQDAELDKFYEKAVN